MLARRLRGIAAALVLCHCVTAGATSTDDGLTYFGSVGGTDSGLFQYIFSFLLKSEEDKIGEILKIHKRLRAMAPIGPFAAATDDPPDGTLTQVPGTLINCPADSGAIHPNGRFIYVASDYTEPGQVCAYVLDQDSGAIAPIPGQPFKAGSGAGAAAIDPTGTFVFVANYDASTVSGFSIDAATGALTAIPGSPFATGVGPRSIVVSPDGRFVYTANQQGGNVSGFAIDRQTGALSPLPASPYAIASFPIGLAIDPRGRFVYVAAGSVQTLAIDAATGALRVVAATSDTLIRYVAADPSARYVYGTSEFDGPGGLGRITPYAVGADGTLTLAGPRVIAGQSAGAVVVNRFARYVYVANLLDGSASGYAIDAATGALTPIEGSPFATGMNTIGLAAGGSLPTSSAWEAGVFLFAPIGVGGGRLPYTWKVDAGTLPPGLTLDSELAALRGVPTTPGISTFTLRVTDAAGVSATRAFTLDIRAAEAPSTATVIEYYHAGLDHYFITWIADEIAKLDAGTVIAGWTRTGKSFGVFTAPTSATSPVCRYYIPPLLGDSHFFGRGTAECDATGAKNPSFVLEASAFMHMILPTAGVCPPGTVNVYRVFSNRPDANHRYMTDKSLRDQMVAKGWLAEGDGPDLVVMCAPT